MLEVGKIYLIPTAASRKGVCIANISEDRALFVIDNKVTPFVSWWHSKPNGDQIDCACGSYYKDLKSAVEGERICD